MTKINYKGFKKDIDSNGLRLACSYGPSKINEPIEFIMLDYGGMIVTSNDDPLYDEQCNYFFYP